jgi:hypothetical protein
MPDSKPSLSKLGHCEIQVTNPATRTLGDRKALLPFLKPDLVPNPIFAGHSYDCEGSELSVP